MSKLESGSTASKTDLFLKVLAGQAIEAQCQKCQAVEFVVPLDEPIDEVFLANYHCDKCDSFL